jgi:hypothetical protein
VTLICTALLLSATSPCADRTGTYDARCEVSYLRLPSPKNSHVKNELILVVHNPAPIISMKIWVSPDWHAISAKRCLAAGSCEDAVQARIHFDDVNDNEGTAAGAFNVDFANGDHEEGKFGVKYHHKGRRLQCVF